MNPSQAEFLLQFLLPQVTSEYNVTKRILSAIPLDQGAYRPAPASMSALGLAWHIVLAEMWFLDAVIARQFGEFAERASDADTGHGVAQWYEKGFQQRLPILAALPGDHLATPVDFHGLRNDPAVAYLNIMIRHSVHHRGQLSAYLRPMGAKVPAIYVESGDEPWPPEDATPGPITPPPAF